MPWLTHLIGMKVVDADGRSLGRVQDLLAERGPFPRVTRVSFRLSGAGRGRFATGRPSVFIPWERLSPSNRSFRLDDGLPLSEEELSDDEGDEGLRLREDLLDKQIVDTEGARVVRVNDVWLAESTGGLRVVGADVGLGGVLRRLGLESGARRVAGALEYEIPDRLIGWNYIAPLDERRGDVRLTVTSRLLRELRPSELADILDELDPERRERFLRVMTDADLASTLAETNPEVSVEAIQVLGEERVRRAIELMPPDEAADLLGGLGYERAERLLKLMGLGQAEVLRELLGYAPDTAGGRMTPSYVAVSAEATADGAISQIRAEARSAETINYAYVLDEDGQLQGVLSLRDLLRSPPERRVDDIMERDVVASTVTEDQAEVARTMARYDLLALPVVDEQRRLRGIVTVDDIVEVLEEEASEDLAEVTGVYLGEGPGVHAGRLAGFAVSLFAGVVAALMLDSQRAEIRSIAPVAWLLPLYLRVAQDLGTWSLARALANPWPLFGRRLDFLTQELLASLATAGVSGLVVGVFGTWWTQSAAAGVFLGVGIFVGSLTASLIGLVLPPIARALRLSRLLVRGRPLAVIVGLATLVVYVWALSSLATRLP